MIPDSARSEFCRMLSFIVDLFLQAAGSPSAPPPPPHTLFEDFFGSSAPPSSLIFLNWFERIRTTLTDAGTRMASFVTSGCGYFSFLPPRNSSYAVSGDLASCHAAPVNTSLLSLFGLQLKPSHHVGMSIQEAAALEASVRSQSETLSHSMWILSGLLAFVQLQNFGREDSSLFNTGDIVVEKPSPLVISHHFLYGVVTPLRKLRNPLASGCDAPVEAEEPLVPLAPSPKPPIVRFVQVRQYSWHYSAKHDAFDKRREFVGTNKRTNPDSLFLPQQKPLVSRVHLMKVVRKIGQQERSRGEHLTVNMFKKTFSNGGKNVTSSSLPDQKVKGGNTSYSVMCNAGIRVFNPKYPHVSDKYTVKCLKMQEKEREREYSYRTTILPVYLTQAQSLNCPINYPKILPFQEYGKPVYSYSTNPDRRFSSSTSQHFKMSPPFASSEGVLASGDRLQSDGVQDTHLLPHS